jgi:methionine-rich copper-binding protein CopC
MKRLLVLTLSIPLFMASTPIAEAHSTLVSSLPRSGSILTAIPAKVTLTFNERLLVLAGEHPNSIAVTSPSGHSVTTGPTSVKGNSVSIDVNPKKVSGKFRVSYRVVSADGHPISGEIFFTVK